VTISDKGSLVTFSKVEIRWGSDAPAFPLRQDTFLSLTNDGSSDVSVLMYFVNGDPPLAPVFDGGGNLVERGHPGWNWLDVQAELTANQPSYWSALSGQPGPSGGVSPFTALDPGTPPGRPALDGTGDRVLRGFVLAWAVNPDGEEIRWNHLAGNATIVHYANGSAWEYATYNYPVVSAAAPGQPSDGTPGVLGLDAIEYAIGYDLLLFNFQAPGSGAFGDGDTAVVSDTDLTLHPISADLRQTHTGPVTTKANFDIWNMNEVKFSGTHRCVTCWDQTLLSRYDAPNHFNVAHLQTQHGKARIDGHASAVCNVLDDPDTPEDESVVSQAASILGVAARLLAFDGGAAFGATGYSLVGMGTQAGTVRYDVITAPPEAEADGLALPPMRPTNDELIDFIDSVLHERKN
jgi:hypothetical protein